MGVRGLYGRLRSAARSFFDLGNFSRCVVSGATQLKLPKNPEERSMRDV